MKKEIIWKPIPGYEGYYEASSTGLIRSVDRIVVLKTRYGDPRPCNFKSRILKPFARPGKRSNIAPRYEVALAVDGKLRTWQVHQLIAKTFMPNPNPELYDTINHIDGNSLNNSIDNLEWASRADNIRHSFKHDLVHTQKPVAMLNEDGSIKTVYPGESEACRRMGVGQGKIRRAILNHWRCRNHYWRYIDENEPVTTIESWKGFFNE